MELDQFIKELQERKRAASQGADPSKTAPPARPSTDAGQRLPLEAPSSIGQAAPVAPALEGFDRFKQQIHNNLIKVVDPEELRILPPDRQRPELRLIIDRLINADNHPLSGAQKRQVIEEILDDVLGFGPLEPLLGDATISDILINGPFSVYVERSGVLEEVGVRFRDNDHLMEIIQRIVSKVGRRVNESSPMVDARLPDGSRFNAIVPPLALDGPMVSIRRFGNRPLKIADLLALKAFTPEMCRFMEVAVKARLNIVISGGTGSGKTTLLNTLSSFIPANERIVTIEDAAEVRLQQRHVGRLESRPPNIEGKGEITIRDLLRNALRMRPNRIVIGECRGAEALDMLQAMNTGHDGSMTTLHANSPRDALARLETMIMLSQLDLPLRAMRQQIASAVNLIIQVERLPGGPRRVTNITEIIGMEGEVVVLQDLFSYRQHGVDAAGKAFGEFVATGVASHYDAKFRAAGVTLPGELFSQRVLAQA